MAVAVSIWRREAMFLTAMLASETGIVGLNTLFKVATSKGLNSYSFLGYSYLLASLLLLPSHLFSNSRSTSLPPLSFSILCKIGLLGLIGSTYVITSYIGVKYSNPTLASAISNITPALTFILAVIFRMEKVRIKERSSVAKVMGTILSLVGAFVVVLYHGPRVFIVSSPPYLKFPQLTPSLASSNSDWIIGGCLLTIRDIFVSVSFILQAHIMSEYPAAFTVSFFYTLLVSIITSSAGLVVERNNPSVWIIRFDITLICILAMGIFTPVYYVIHSWTVRYKGPLYLAIFKPLSILIAFDRRSFDNVRVLRCDVGESKRREDSVRERE
ncbi:WAT1-related protein [Hirschfeldia incana]|nr:WAT1-related protein [Hirschfeldia incana]